MGCCKYGRLQLCFLLWHKLECGLQALHGRQWLLGVAAAATLVLLVLLRRRMNLAFRLVPEAPLDHGQHHGSILCRVEQTWQRMLPALLCATAAISRHLEASLILVPDLDDVDKASIVPHAALELQLAAVLDHDELAHLCAHAF